MKIMKKIFLILLSISLIFFSACSKQNETVEKIETKNEINTTKIVTTVAPIASIIQYI
jgi:ABC-type Zn uptake system ZnuABC Zn-binding protein ZnuA